jgi:hypothetical protein
VQNKSVLISGIGIAGPALVDSLGKIGLEKRFNATSKCRGHSLPTSKSRQSNSPVRSRQRLDLVCFYATRLLGHS